MNHLLKFAGATTVVGPMTQMININDSLESLEFLQNYTNKYSFYEQYTWKIALQRVVRSAEHITHTELPDLQTIYHKRCQTKARRIVKDPTHPNNRLFSLLRSGRHSEDQDRETEEKLLPTGHSGPESGKLINCGDHHHHVT
ncbi:hypothetical protein P4O66_012913 [Electrophorus voltai]|uniref:Uncharacterized protein n=1 Tax=Electrophorus voltai TaxID=2609070 RepID=A0AAD9E657_9TELE|nr:hypothetical protein P4O66_012913 [Electrophorus voltai]